VIPLWQQDGVFARRDWYLNLGAGQKILRAKIAGDGNPAQGAVSTATIGKFARPAAARSNASSARALWIFIMSTEGTEIRRVPQALSGRSLRACAMWHSRLRPLRIVLA